MANISKITLPSGTTYDIISKTGRGIIRCETDSTSTSTAFVVIVDGLTELYDGIILLIKNTKVTSASNCTLNVNGLGAKRIWLSQSNGYCTTHWGLNQTYLFIYDATNEKWELQQGRDTDGNDTSTIRPYYSHPTVGGNGIKQYGLFARLLNNTYASFTTNNGTGTKTFDTANYFDPTKLFYYNGSGNLASGAVFGSNTFSMSVNRADLRYSFNGVTTSASTSSITGNKPVFMVFDKTSENKGCYKLKSPYWTQTPNDTSALYVLIGYAEDSYRMDLWLDNPLFTWDGTNLVRFTSSGATNLSGLTDVDVSGVQSGDILSYDGSEWVNSNGISFNNGYLRLCDVDGNLKVFGWIASYDSGATTRGNLYLYDENGVSRIKMYGDGGIVLCDTNNSTTVDLDSSNSKVSTFSGTANVSPKFRAYRSDSDVGVSLQVDADGERNGVYSETYEGYLIHSDLLQRIYIGEKLNGSTELWEGTLSSGSITFPATYDFYIIEGDITNNASRYTAAVIPKNIIDQGTGKQYCYADESKYITFTIARTDDTITLKIGSKTGTGGIRRIIGVN